MKKLYSLTLGLLVAAFLFSGCDDLTTVDFDFEVITEHSLNVVGTTQSLTAPATVDLKENSEFSKYESTISNASVDSVQYRIENYNNNPSTVLNGRIDVAESTTSPTTLLYSINNWNIQNEQTRTANGWVTLPLTEEGKNKLSSLIKNDPHAATILLTGSTSETPENFTALFKIYWKITASKDVL